MLRLRSGPGEVRVMDSYVLQLLQSVVRSRSQGVEPGRVEVACGDMTIG